jgi:hypothetical protein
MQYNKHIYLTHEIRDTKRERSLISDQQSSNPAIQQCKKYTNATTNHTAQKMSDAHFRA